jgi:hypothetical protein
MDCFEVCSKWLERTDDPHGLESEGRRRISRSKSRVVDYVSPSARDHETFCVSRHTASPHPPKTFRQSLVRFGHCHYRMDECFQSNDAPRRLSREQTEVLRHAALSDGASKGIATFRTQPVRKSAASENWLSVSAGWRLSAVRFPFSG